MNETSTHTAADSGHTPRLTLRKGEKLRHRTLVESLFREGASLYAYPLRLVWRKLDADSLSDSFRTSVPDRIGPLQMLVTIPKKKRRHAVDRVLMRRRVREAYRLRRAPIRALADADAACRSLDMAFIYIADKNVDYQTVERKMELLLKKLAEAAFGTRQHTES